MAWHLQEGGLKPWQAEKCRDNRFTAMLFDKYGGRKALKEVIRTGRLKQIRLGQTHRRLAMRVPKINEIPPLRPRYIDNKERSAKEKKSQIRAKYYGNMAEQLKEAVVSTTVRQELMCSRISRIMVHRQDNYLMGQPKRYTTCKWPQHHLWCAGASVPAVQWQEKYHKKSKRRQFGLGARQ